MAAYHEFSNEHRPPSLAHHYVAYRAHVRTKIACLRIEQGDTSGAELARTYHALVLHHLERARVRRLANPDNPSDATPDLVDLLTSRRDPWPDATSIDTTAPIDDVVRSAVAAVNRYQ